ncbi:MAG: hypothetical protein MZW92_48080 [Comamonadaceae bacterium]|nr:hypothetical protein [Comamonadaceae bacterium]
MTGRSAIAERHEGRRHCATAASSAGSMTDMYWKVNHMVVPKGKALVVRRLPWRSARGSTGRRSATLETRRRSETVAQPAPSTSTAG